MRGIERSSLARARVAHPHTHACMHARVYCVCAVCARLDGRGYGLTILSFLVSPAPSRPLFRIGIARAERSVFIARAVVGARESEAWWCRGGGGRERGERRTNGRRRRRTRARERERESVASVSNLG